MIPPAFEVTHCAWPRPVQFEADRWVSEPDWDALAMPRLPDWQRVALQDAQCWMIDWCVHFDGGLRRYNGHTPGEMRGFHVVFHLRVRVSGALTFWSDDGCIVRCNGVVLHEDRATHPLTRSTISVTAGDVLEIAQWQNHGAWKWGAELAPTHADLLPYRSAVAERLREPNGPALKLYFGDATPLRAVVALYSMVLNGYRPASIHLFGDYQWSPSTRQLLADLLPFAHVEPTAEVLAKVRSLGQPGLAELAQRHWAVMKAVVCLLCPPYEFCCMDDDVVILDTVELGLAAFRNHPLVYAPDADYSAAYCGIWGGVATQCIGRINTGLFWLRNTRDLRRTAAAMAQVAPQRAPLWQWEQGFVATYFADEPHCGLPGQRYFYPFCDGLPGGIAAYDYANNPCGFVSIHFGGLAEKPTDAEMLKLAPLILACHTDT